MAAITSVGPHNPRFHQDVGEFLKRNPPTDTQKACLRRFFEDLRGTAVPVSGEEFANGEIKYIGQCDHVIVFYEYGALVRRIEPAIP